MQTGITDIDLLLHPYLQEKNEERSQLLLTQLIAEEIDPIIKRIIVYRLGVMTNRTGGWWSDQQIQDLRGEVLVRILTKLRDLKRGTSEKAIKDFRSYAAVITHNVCSEHLRRQNFQYSRLKDHLRYVLNTQPGFALWEDKQNGWLGGFAKWRDQRAGWRSTASSRNIEDLISAKLNTNNSQQRSIAEQLALIFEEAGKPVEFRELIKIIAAWRGIDLRNTPNEYLEMGGDALVTVSGRQVASPESEIEQRLYLQKLWREICELPLPHRTALLLNLRDRESEERGLIVSLADLRIATIREIAEVLAIPPEEFAAIWIDLPWDDLRIAQHLETTRQKVINLRKAARKILARRMKDLTETS